MSFSAFMGKADILGGTHLGKRVAPREGGSCRPRPHSRGGENVLSSDQLNRFICTGRSRLQGEGPSLEWPRYLRIGWGRRWGGNAWGGRGCVAGLFVRHD